MKKKDNLTNVNGNINFGTNFNTNSNIPMIESENLNDNTANTLWTSVSQWVSIGFFFFGILWILQIVWNSGRDNYTPPTTNPLTTNQSWNQNHVSQQENIIRQQQALIQQQQQLLNEVGGPYVPFGTQLPTDELTEQPNMIIPRALRSRRRARTTTPSTTTAIQSQSHPSLQSLTATPLNNNNNSNGSNDLFNSGGKNAMATKATNYLENTWQSVMDSAHMIPKDTQSKSG